MSPRPSPRPSPLKGRGGGQDLEQAVRQAGDVVVLYQVAPAALAHLHPFLWCERDEALDGIGQDLGIAGRDAESRLRVTHRVVGRLAEEDDRPASGEVVGELVEADAEPV